MATTDVRASIQPGEPEWLTTFPHVVTPLRDEWLPGLMLRCDVANGWSSGKTAQDVSRMSTGCRTLARPALHIVAPTFDLPLLAVALGIPLQALEATTFKVALRQLYPAASLHTRLLGPIPAFRVCPACVAERSYVSRTLALPHIESCLHHSVLLQGVCRCGNPLQLFAPERSPFTCSTCSLPWGALPQVRVTEVVRVRDRLCHALYRRILHGGPTETSGEVLQRIRSAAHARGYPVSTPASKAVPALHDMPGSLYPNLSVAGLVSAAYTVGLRPDDLTSVRQATRVAWDPVKEVMSTGEVPFVPEQPAAIAVDEARDPCPNRACPLYRRERMGNVRRFGRWHDQMEYFCNECGSRYIGKRLIMTFDATHGSATISPASVARAIARLGRWRDNLRRVCAEMLAHHDPISLRAAFTRAGIPCSANLRATRLGLRAIVERAAQEQLERLEAAAMAGAARWEVRRYMYRRSERSLHRIIERITL